MTSTAISPPAKSLLTRSTIAGGVLWIALLFIPLTVHGEMADVTMLLLLGILVIVPLAIELLTDSTGEESAAFHVATNLQPIGAVTAAVSYFFHEGLGAALLVTPWLLFSLAVSMEGARRLWVQYTGKRLSVATLVQNVGMVALPGGAGWLLISRLGFDPGPYGELIVLLTAVHFHFAAFIAPVWAGFLGSEMIHKKSGWYPVFRIVGLGLVLGTPLVAFGIAASPFVETTGVLVLASSAFVLGLLGVLVAFPISDWVGRAMMLVSSLSLCTAMIWAFAFNLGPRFGWPSPDVLGMIPRHGWVQGVGFALVGILAWRRLNVKCAC